MNNIVVENHVCHIDEDSLTIIDSYNVTCPHAFLIKFFTSTDSYPKRSIRSMSREWYTYNLLYKLNIMRKYTKSITFKDDPSIFRIILYNIIWFICGKLLKLNIE